MHRLRTAGLLAGALALPLSLTAASPGAAAPAPHDPAPTVAAAERAGSASGYARAAFRETNRQRAKRDLVTLKRQKCLQRKARQQARRMARQGEIFHQDLGPVLSDCGLRQAGENVAMGYPTGRAVVRKGWMRSPGHRANILRGSYRLMGLAAKRADGQWYVAQVFGTR